MNIELTPEDLERAQQVIDAEHKAGVKPCLCVKIGKLFTDTLDRADKCPSVAANLLSTVMLSRDPDAAVQSLKLGALLAYVAMTSKESEAETIALMHRRR